MKEFLYKISTKLKGEIKDPQGEVVEKIASRLNISKNLKVKQGKFYEIKLKAEDKTLADKEIEALIKSVLINPIVETYTIEKIEEI